MNCLVHFGEPSFYLDFIRLENTMEGNQVELENLLTENAVTKPLGLRHKMRAIELMSAAPESETPCYICERSQRETVQRGMYELPICREHAYESLQTRVVMHNKQTVEEAEAELHELMLQNAYGSGLSKAEYRRASFLISTAPLSEKDCWVCPTDDGREANKGIYNTSICRGHHYYALATRK